LAKAISCWSILALTEREDNLLREYEFTVITRNDLADADRAKALEKYETLFQKEGGEFIVKDEWGSRKMAFPMKKQYRGFYTHYDMTCHSDSLKEAERLLRIDENVLRYLLIKTNDKVDVEKRREELEKLKAKMKAKTDK